LRVPLALIAAAICLIAGIVALVIVLLKTGSLTDATTAPAMYLFIAAMFLTAAELSFRRARAIGLNPMPLPAAAQDRG
jgi:hypothetical protein